MNHNDSKPTEKPLVQAATEKPARLFFADHLRAFLVILVVLHHAAWVQSGYSFYDWEPALDGSLSSLLMVLFMLFNQAWFMGALFFLAGYFTPGSYDRKGANSFLRGRLIRLGIPLLVFVFVLHPPLIYWAEQQSEVGPRSLLNYLETGQMWFVAILLIFSFAYAAWRKLTENRASSPPSESSPPGYVAMGIFVLVLALATYLLRVIIPLERYPYPQYISFFVLSTVAYRRDWLRSIPNSTGVVGLVIALAASLVLFPIAWLSGQHQGNGTWQSAVYALWDSTFAVGMLLGAITLFRRRFNGQGRFGPFLAQHSYAVYILHLHVIVGVVVMLGGTGLPVFLKFILVSIIGVPLSFAVAYLVRKIPGVARVV
jgi:glucan biosynthesis protein C